MDSEKTPPSASVDSIVMRLQRGANTHLASTIDLYGPVDELLLDASDSLLSIVEAWQDFRDELIAREPGDKFHFRCESLQRIDMAICRAIGNCRECGGRLRVIGEQPPYSPRYLQCENCDSTFNA